ncbi:MAG: thiamine pyrophosphate-binding protein [Pseudomonadales bacterium]
MAEEKINQLIPERMLELMEAEGIKTLFGIPDPGFVAMFVTAEARGWRVIAPHHEQAGAFMADGLYRMTGIPGVIIGNQGPGVANLAPAAICAAKENIPTLFIAGQRERMFDQQVRRGHFQYTRQARYFEEAMKYVGVIEYPDQVDDIFHEAFSKSLSGTPGTVWIEYPQDFAGAMHSFGPIKQPHEYRLIGQKADAESLEKARELLTEATHPMILLGNGAFAARAHQAVSDLARCLQCPVVVTPGAGALLPAVLDQMAPYASPPANHAIEQADVVLAIGTELGEPVHFGSGRHWLKGNTGRSWIYVERDPTAIGVNRSIDVPLVGDLRAIVPQLVDVLNAHAGQKRLPESFTAFRGEARAAQQEALASFPSTSPIHPALLVTEATRALPEDTVIIRDGGAASIWTMHYNQQASSDVLWCGNFGHLGTGLPHAIGAQLAVGDKRRVVLMTGDSSFLFHISELETAVRKNLPIVAIVNCDYSWGLEVKVYNAAFGDQSPETEAHWGNQLRLDKIAEGFGAHGEYVSRVEEIAPAVARALAANRPAVVQVPVDSRANAIDVPGFEEFVTWYGDKGYS